MRIKCYRWLSANSQMAKFDLQNWYYYHWLYLKRKLNRVGHEAENRFSTTI